MKNSLSYAFAKGTLVLVSKLQRTLENISDIFRICIINLSVCPCILTDSVGPAPTKIPAKEQSPCGSFVIPLAQPLLKYKSSQDIELSRSTYLLLVFQNYASTYFTHTFLVIWGSSSHLLHYKYRIELQDYELTCQVRAKTSLSCEKLGHIVATLYGAQFELCFYI